MNQTEIEPETRAVLDRIRHSSRVLSIFEMPADLAETAVWEIGRVLVDNQHLPNVQYQTYRWYLREVAKLLRTRTGWNLALELEICLRKWQDYRLDPVLCQALVRECCDRIAAMTPEEIEENPNDESRMTIETRNPNEQPRKHEGHETDGLGEKTAKDAKSAKVQMRTSADYADSADCVSAPGTNGERSTAKGETAKDAKNAKPEPDSTTKAPRHYPRQMTNDEGRMTNEARSPNARDEERCTMDESAVPGGGNG